VIEIGEVTAEGSGVEASFFEVPFVALVFVARTAVGAVDCFMVGFLVVRG
jgi:hypothetical protein